MRRRARGAGREQWRRRRAMAQAIFPFLTLSICGEGGELARRVGTLLLSPQGNPYDTRRSLPAPPNALGVGPASQERTHPAERRLWELVRDHRCGGLGFRRQPLVGPFRPDFYCPAKKLAVEVDGGIHQEPEIIRWDQDRQRILEADFKIRFLRVTNEDVLKRPAETITAILAAAAFS